MLQTASSPCPIATLTALLATMPDAGWDPNFVNPRPAYRHKPSVEQITAAKDYVLHRPAGITKWLNDRQVALKASEAKMLEAKFERDRIAEQKADEAAKRAAARKAKADSRQYVYGPWLPDPPLTEGAKHRIQQNRNAAANKTDKLSKIGQRWQKFTHRAGHVADRWYAPFEEQFTLPDGTVTGLRSHNGSISTPLFASLLPKEHLLEWGNDKRKLLRYDVSQRKIFILDAPYVCTDPRRLGILVVDLDTNWESEEALLDAIRKIVGSNKMPNLIVYRWSEDGTEIESPHLIWLLPPKNDEGKGGCVGTTGKSNQGIVQFFHKVQRALVAKFIPIGADIGHHNVAKVKNPLSPYWNLFVNDDHFVSLSEWKNILSLNISEDEMTRLSAVHQVAGIENAPISQSDNAWNTVYKLIKAARDHATKSRDRTHSAAKRSYVAYYAWLESKIRDEAIKLLGAGPVTERILRKQLDYRAVHRNTKLQAVVRNRGRDRLLNQMTGADILDKRGNAGSNTRKGQRKTSIRLVADFIRPLVNFGHDFSMAKVCNTIKTVSRSTAYEVYHEALQVVRDALRYSAKPTRHQSKNLASCSQVTLSKQSVPETSSIVPSAEPPAIRIPAKHRDPDPCGDPATRSNHDPACSAIALPRPTVSHGIRPPTLH